MRKYHVIYIIMSTLQGSDCLTSEVGCFDRLGAEEMMRCPEQFNVTNPKRIRAREIQRYTDDPQRYVEEVMSSGYFCAS